MKTIKITRTITYIEIVYKAVNVKTEEIETLKCYGVIDHELTSDEERKFAKSDMPNGYVFLKMESSYMTSRLYEMTAEDFMKYGTDIGDGRKSFN